MERFSYPSLEAARRESAELLQLLEYEHWGRGKDELEEIELQKAKIAEQGR